MQFKEAFKGTNFNFGSACLVKFCPWFWCERDADWPTRKEKKEKRKKRKKKKKNAAQRFIRTNGREMACSVETIDKPLKKKKTLAFKKHSHAWEPKSQKKQITRPVLVD